MRRLRKIYARNLALNKKIPFLPRSLCSATAPARKLKAGTEFIRYTALNQLYRPIISLVRPATHVDRIVFLRRNRVYVLHPFQDLKRIKTYIYIYISDIVIEVQKCLLDEEISRRNRDFPRRFSFFRGGRAIHDRFSAVGGEAGMKNWARSYVKKGGIDLPARSIFRGIGHRIYETYRINGPLGIVRLSPLSTPRSCLSNLGLSMPPYLRRRHLPTRIHRSLFYRISLFHDTPISLLH